MTTVSSDSPLVSVVIPCYQQAHFLSEAIESVVSQTYSHHEILVVDDGSTDDAARVAGRYAVRYVRQVNSGTAAARNKGFRESVGDLLVFLDADDRLLPNALEAGLASLSAHPEAAFAFGLSRMIGQDGSALNISQSARSEDDYYLALLKKCDIWHPAAVIVRRSTFESVAGFDESLPVSSDYDFYLRVARRSTICGHNRTVSEYRQHSSNKSLDCARMLEYILRILRSQRAFVRGRIQYERGYMEGMVNWQAYYCVQSAKQVGRYLLVGGDRRQAMRNVWTILKYGPRALAWLTLAASYRIIASAWCPRS